MHFPRHWFGCVMSLKFFPYRFISSVVSVHFSRSVVSWFFATPWTTARQASLSITNSQSSLKLLCIVSVMPSNHLSLCRPLLFLPSIFPSIRVFSNESALRIRWPKYWNFSFNISPSSEHPGLISFQFSSVKLLSHVRLFATPWTAARQDSCPSPTPGLHPNPCPLSWWCHPTISSSVVPFSSCPQSFPA